MKGRVGHQISAIFIWGLRIAGKVSVRWEYNTFGEEGLYIVGYTI